MAPDFVSTCRRPRYESNTIKGWEGSAVLTFIPLGLPHTGSSSKLPIEIKTTQMFSNFRLFKFFCILDADFTFDFSFRS